MNWTLFWIAWIVGAAIGYFMFRNHWLETYDFTRKDRRAFIALALFAGIVAPLCALFVMGLYSEGKKGREVLIKQRKRDG